MRKWIMPWLCLCYPYFCYAKLILSMFWFLGERSGLYDLRSIRQYQYVRARLSWRKIVLEAARLESSIRIASDDLWLACTEACDSLLTIASRCPLQTQDSVDVVSLADSDWSRSYHVHSHISENERRQQETLLQEDLYFSSSEGFSLSHLPLSLPNYFYSE